MEECLRLDRVIESKASGCVVPTLSLLPLKHTHTHTHTQSFHSHSRTLTCIHSNPHTRPRTCIRSYTCERTLTCCNRHSQPSLFGITDLTDLPIDFITEPNPDRVARPGTSIVVLLAAKRKKVMSKPMLEIMRRLVRGLLSPCILDLTLQPWF